MNTSQMKNYAFELHKLWLSGQFLEYAKGICSLYDNYTSDVVEEVMKYLYGLMN